MSNATVIPKGKTQVRGCVNYVSADLELVTLKGRNSASWEPVYRASQIGRTLSPKGKGESTQYRGVNIMALIHPALGV